jgi:hypothetical protein
MRVLVCLFRTCFPPLGIGSHLSPDGGGIFPSAVHRLGRIGSHLSPDGGGIFPSDVHRLAADGYGR